jgi:hypothetical protein
MTKVKISPAALLLGVTEEMVPPEGAVSGSAALVTVLELNRRIRSGR